MPEPAAPRYDGIRAPLRPSATGSARPPPAPSARRRPTRIARIRMGLLAGLGALILLVIFIGQNAHAVHITFFGAHASVSLGGALLAAGVAGALVMAARAPRGAPRCGAPRAGPALLATHMPPPVTPTGTRTPARDALSPGLSREPGHGEPAAGDPARQLYDCPHSATCCRRCTFRDPHRAAISASHV